MNKNWGWTDEKIKLLGTDTDVAIAKKLGKSANTVSAKRIRSGIDAFGIQKSHGLKIMSFRRLEKIDQHAFFQEMSLFYKHYCNEELTYKKLSEICYWSISRLQKWFTCGSAQEPLSKAIRHHIFVAIKYEIYYKKFRLKTPRTN